LAVPWKVVLLAVFIHTLWGGNIIAIKFGLLVFPPLWSAFWRFLLGAVCLFLWARFTGVPVLPRRGEWRGLLLLGLMFTVQVWAMNLGIDLTTGAMAAVLAATNPLFGALLAHYFIPSDRLTPVRGMGLLLAFAGVALLFLNDGGDFLQGSTRLGNLVLLGSSALLGARLIFTSALVRRIEPTRVMLWQMILALPFFALAGGALEQVRWEALAWPPVLGIAYQGIVVAGFAFMVNATLLKRYSPTVVIGFNFVSPLSGVWLSSLLLFEHISWTLLAGLFTVALGLILINRK